MPDLVDDGQSHEYKDVARGIIGEGVLVFRAPEFPNAVVFGISMTGKTEDPMPVVPMSTIDAQAVAGNIMEAVKEIESQ
jgi:hypothetical protein